MGAMFSREILKNPESNPDVLFYCCPTKVSKGLVSGI